MIRPMTHRQQLLLASGCGLLFLLAMLLVWMFMLQKKPEEPEGLPAETTAVSSETATESIYSTETTTQTETSTAETTGTTTVLTTVTSTTVTTTTTTTTQTEVIPVESITLTFYEVQLTIGETAMPIVTMHPENAADKSEIWSTSDNNIASISGWGKITAKAEGECIIRVTSAENPEVYAEVHVIVTAPPPTEPPTDPPTEPHMEAPAEEPPVTEAPAVQPTYINGILVVNKTYALPADYNPGLDPTCKAQFDTLVQAAAAEGLNIYLSSGFRSYDYQARIYNNYLNWYGQEKTDTLSARAGHSEHQTGLAIDVNTITDSFGSTPEAAWLAEHAHEFGFIIRYPKGKEHITGYKYEPWHLRYLGLETAAAVYSSGLTLEEYLGVTSCYAE